MNKISIGIDTSGNTGKNLGTTGYVKIEKDIKNIWLGFTMAMPNESEDVYFKKILNTLNKLLSTDKESQFFITVEKYIEYGKGATKFSTPPTIKLNHEIENWTKEKIKDGYNIIYKEKPASHLKTRWSDKVLVEEGFKDLYEFKYRKIKPNTHMIDALRASLDGWYFGKKEEKLFTNYSDTFDIKDFK